MMRHCYLLTLVLIVFGVWGALSAGEWDYFFSNNNVTALCPAEDAYWIGTSTGLLKMDPVSGQLAHYHMGNSALPSNQVMSVVEGWDGRVWVGTYDGLASFDGVNWESWTSDRLGIEQMYDCPRNIVSSMITDQDKNIWVCFQHWECDIDEYNADTVVARISPLTVDWEYFETDFDLIGSFQGLVLAATRTGSEEYSHGPNDKLFVYDGIKSKIVDLELGLDDVSYALHQGGDLIIMPDIYYGTEGSSQLFIIQRITTGVSHGLVEELDFPGEKIQLISNDVEGNVFAVIDEKPWSWNGYEWEGLPALEGKFSNSPSFSGLKEYSPSIIAVTENGNTLTVDGNKLWDSATNETHYLHSSGHAGVSETYVMDIDRDGVVWFATSGGLVSYDGALWVLISYPFEKSTEYGVKACLAVNSQSEVWLGYNDDLYMVDGNKLVWKKKIAGMQKLFFDCQDQLWVLGADKLLRMQEGVWKQITTQESGLPSSGLLEMCIDPNGKVWVLSEKKVHSFNGSRWSSINHPAQKDELNGFCVDSQGGIWLIRCGSNFEGYIVYRNQKWQSEEGYAAMMHSMVADKFGGWWCWTGFPGRGDGLAYHHNGHEIAEVEGSPWAFCHGIYIDYNNNKWFLLENEIAVYNENGVDFQFPTARNGN